MRKILILTLFGLAISLSTSSVSLAGPGDPPGAEKARADATRAYWTPSRLENAKPRDMERPEPPRQSNRPGPSAERGKPGGGGGGGGGTSPAPVTGASWNPSGLVKSATGKVFFHMGDGDWTCSGAVINDGGAAGRSLVLTAAHCAYDEVGGAFASYWMFIPDYDSGGSSSWYFGTCPASRCWVASHLVAPTQWAANGPTKWEEDYAFAVILDSAHGGASLEARTGVLPIDFNNSPYTATTWINAFGYPASKKFSGADLVYCASSDHVLDDSLEQTTAIRCNMTSGASGGPWLEGFDASDQSPVGAVRSVTSYSYASANGYLFGPIFDSYTSKSYEAAKVTGDSALIAP